MTLIGGVEADPPLQRRRLARTRELGAQAS
jgi:hypothetical protein